MSERTIEVSQDRVDFIVVKGSDLIQTGRAVQDLVLQIERGIVKIKSIQLSGNGVSEQAFEVVSHRQEKGKIATETYSLDALEGAFKLLMQDCDERSQIIEAIINMQPNAVISFPFKIV